MTARWYHMALLIAIGYVLGYYFPQLAQMSVGKIKAA
jgi:hypothetical protein